MKFVFVTVAILTLTNCSPAPIVVETLTHVPSEPYLPKISDEELSCLPDSTYERLARRDQALRMYSEQLRTILKKDH